MKKFKAASLVVDADVARAAGLSEKPVSSSARAVLLAIADPDAGLKIAFSPDLRAEWKRHASVFATTWLANMVARGKVVRVNPPALTANEVQKAPLSDNHKQIAEKDAHLLDIALATHQFIASNDKTARAVFCLLSNHSILYNDTIWVVPTDCADALVAIMKNGGFIPSEWHLFPGS